MGETPSSSASSENPVKQTLVAKILDFVEPARSETDSFNMKELSEELMSSAIKVDNVQEERPVTESPEISHQLMTSEGCSSSSRFLTPEDVSIPGIKASLIPFYRGGRRIQVLHKDVVLKLVCTHLKVRFGLSTKFVDKAGRPRLSFVVNAPPGLCQVLEACDNLVKNSFMQSGSTSDRPRLCIAVDPPPGLCQVLDVYDNHVQNSDMQSGSTSDWRPVVTRKDGYWNFPTVRLHIPTIVSGDVAKCSTEIFQKEAGSGAEQKLQFTTLDAAELDSLLTSGTCIDAFFSLDPYDYLQKAGIRLVAEKLVIHS